jgi:hypothetical protein
VADTNAFNSAIYGQVQTSAVSFAGQAWDDFKHLQNTCRINKAHDQRPTSLYDWEPIIPLNNFIGEVTTGLLGGFFNSDYQVGGVYIKNMYSNQWWSLNPIVAFSTIQPQNPYYNIYAQVIFDTSHNTVYGVPYSDRFGSGPLVNTVFYNGKNVNYWVLCVGAPAPKALPGVLMLLLE